MEIYLFKPYLTFIGALITSIPKSKLSQSRANYLEMHASFKIQQARQFFNNFPIPQIVLVKDGQSNKANQYSFYLINFYFSVRRTLILGKIWIQK